MHNIDYFDDDSLIDSVTHIKNINIPSSQMSPKSDKLVQTPTVINLKQVNEEDYGSRKEIGGVSP